VTSSGGRLPWKCLELGVTAGAAFFPHEEATDESQWKE